MDPAYISLYYDPELKLAQLENGFTEKGIICQNEKFAHAVSMLLGEISKSVQDIIIKPLFRY